MHFLTNMHPPNSTLFPTRRSSDLIPVATHGPIIPLSTSWTCTRRESHTSATKAYWAVGCPQFARSSRSRSEEHTSELQSPMYLVCRLLLEKNNVLTNFC